MHISALGEILAAHETWLGTKRRQGERAKLINLQLGHADLSGRDLSHAHIELCDLRQANFTASRLVDTWLHSCELDKADFSNAIAVGCQFLSSYALAALFRGADLTNACFMYAKLAGADFSAANLSQADFDEAEFQDAKFNGANIAGVHLARWYVRDEQIQGVLIDAKTRLPMKSILSR